MTAGNDVDRGQGNGGRGVYDVEATYPVRENRTPKKARDDLGGPASAGEASQKPVTQTCASYKARYDWGPSV